MPPLLFVTRLDLVSGTVSLLLQNNQNISPKATMADEIEYKLDNVEATAVAPDDIDKTFRSSSIGTEAGT